MAKGEIVHFRMRDERTEHEYSQLNVEERLWNRLNVQETTETKQQQLAREEKKAHTKNSHDSIILKQNKLHRNMSIGSVVRIIWPDDGRMGMLVCVRIGVRTNGRKRVVALH